ncbi:MAG: exosortase/archaeosortase family protein [Candidatus Omnitrophota bacterium]
MKKPDLIKLSVIAAIVGLSYIPAFKWMIGRWSVADTYYSHGFLVPFISIFLVWLKRDKLSKLKIHPAASGWIFFLGGMAVHLVSMLWQVNFTSGFSLLPVLIGLVLIFLGKDYLRQLIFPISFLAFMIPLPLVAIANMSFRLKIFAAQASTLIINKLGVPAILEGSLIKTAHSRLMVEDPCSGIRSLIALIALGALMAYFSDLSKTKRTILFISSIPIAVATNIIRIVSLSLVSEIYGEKYAMGVFHDTMGLLVFVFAFLGLMLVGKLLE